MRHTSLGTCAPRGRSSFLSDIRKGLVNAKETIWSRDGTKGAIISRSAVLAAGDGFRAEAMKVFRRSKRLDYFEDALAEPQTRPPLVSRKAKEPRGITKGSSVS